MRTIVDINDFFFSLSIGLLGLNSLAELALSVDDIGS